MGMIPNRPVIEDICDDLEGALRIAAGDLLNRSPNLDNGDKKFLVDALKLTHLEKARREAKAAEEIPFDDDELEDELRKEFGD